MNIIDINNLAEQEGLSIRIDEIIGQYYIPPSEIFGYTFKYFSFWRRRWVCGRLVFSLKELQLLRYGTKDFINWRIYSLLVKMQEEDMKEDPYAEN